MCAIAPPFRLDDINHNKYDRMCMYHQSGRVVECYICITLDQLHIRILLISVAFAMLRPANTLHVEHMASNAGSIARLSCTHWICLIYNCRHIRPVRPREHSQSTANTLSYIRNIFRISQIACRLLIQWSVLLVTAHTRSMCIQCALCFHEWCTWLFSWAVAEHTYGGVPTTSRTLYRVRWLHADRYSMHCTCNYTIIYMEATRPNDSNSSSPEHRTALRKANRKCNLNVGIKMWYK